jgi:hypothetical protein
VGHERDDHDRGGSEHRGGQLMRHVAAAAERGDSGEDERVKRWLVRGRHVLVPRGHERAHESAAVGDDVGEAMKLCGVVELCVLVGVEQHEHDSDHEPDGGDRGQEPQQAAVGRG